MPPAPNLRQFPDPEGEFLTYATVRSTLHPVPAEQTLAVPGDVTIRELHIMRAESVARGKRRLAEVEG